MRTIKMLMILGAIALCAAGEARGAEAGARLVLVENGQARAAIVVAGSAREGRLWDSARVLAGHLRQISGAELPVVSIKDLGQWSVQARRFVPEAGKLDPKLTGFILLGESDASRKLGVRLDGLGPGGIRIRTSGNALVLAGVGDGKDQPGGNTYAVYQFLESLGCRWLWPGESGKVIPRLPTLAVGLLDVSFTPEIAWRHIRSITLDKTRNLAAGLDRLGITLEEWAKLRERAMATATGETWMQWQCLGGDLGLSAGHDGAGMGKDAWEKYGKTHPEWFALQGNGKRDQTGTEDRWRECVTAPGLVDFVANKIIEEQKRSPRRNVSLSPNDNGKAGHCLCEACQALDPPEAPQVKFRVTNKPGQSAGKYIMRPALSDRFVWYWDQVAERVTKVYPDLLFVVDAYSGFKTPPVRQKLHPNLVLRYISSDIAGWMGWYAAGAKRIYWRPNNLYNDSERGTLNHFIAPVLARQMGELIDKGMLGTDMDCCLDNWATMGLNYYVAARSNWNPRLKYEAILKDYCGGFGPVGAKIEEYFGRIDALSTSTLERYTPETIAGLKGILSEAAGAAGSDAAAVRRIEFLRAGLEFTEVTTECYRMLVDVRAGRPGPPATIQQAMDRRWAVMRRLTLQEPLALNMPYIAGNEDYNWRELNWKGPGAAAKAAAQ